MQTPEVGIKGNQKITVSEENTEKIVISEDRHQMQINWLVFLKT